MTAGVPNDKAMIYLREPRTELAMNSNGNMSTTKALGDQKHNIAASWKFYDRGSYVQFQHADHVYPEGMEPSATFPVDKGFFNGKRSWKELGGVKDLDTRWLIEFPPVSYDSPANSVYLLQNSTQKYLGRVDGNHIIISDKPAAWFLTPLGDDWSNYEAWDCRVSQWSSWSPCTNGTKTRTRTVLLEPKGDVPPCPKLKETQSCSTSSPNSSPNQSSNPSPKSSPDSSPIWDPTDDAFWSTDNVGMWTYIGAVVAAFFILILVLVM